MILMSSEFSTVMLAVMILEGLGRSLDPNLDLLQEATPFLWAGT
jgi:aarF domain-containing kinase